MSWKRITTPVFDGRASVEEEKQVLDWIDRDPANRRELLAERRLFDSMLMLADPGRTTRKPKVLTLPRWTREVLKYAAVILVIAGAGGIYVSRMYDKFLLTGNTITVPAGQHIDVQLPDGTKVCMNALPNCITRLSSSGASGRCGSRARHSSTCRMTGSILSSSRPMPATWRCWVRNST